VLPPVAAVVIQSSRFESNAADDGGAIAIYNTKSPAVQIQDCNFVGNRAPGCIGGALFTDYAVVNILNSNITRSIGTTGGAIFSQNASMLNITGVQLIDNFADANGGVMAVAGDGFGAPVRVGQLSGQCCTRMASCRHPLAPHSITGTVYPAVIGSMRRTYDARTVMSTLAITPKQAVPRTKCA
jgi:hypothetical protein